MDTKAAFDREAFEKSAAELIGYKPEFILSQRTGDDYEFGSGLNAYWHFWKESRAAIEIELPGQENYDDPLSAYLAIKDCAEAITSHGIRIKGKAE
ncbi:MAG: hypothetical protein [Bacteriophage sp.]|nr:MAG: hypothetical protein [Bacteriophage sp.]